jgi:MtrB/PioB family decaheme-associated outer membrane protein
MKPVKSKKAVTGVFVATTLYLYATVVIGADVPPATAEAANVDISKWKCKYCAFEEGFSGEVEIGAAYVSDDSFKFGEYTGLVDEGAYFIGNADARYRGEDAGYMDLLIRDLGLEMRSIGIEGGRQGKYKLFLRYDEIPHYISDTAMTPYLGTGSNALTLPPGWARAPTTAGMTDLNSSLRQVDLKTKRKRVDVGMAYTPSKWEYKVKYRHEVKDGQIATAGAFFFDASQLIKPVDYVTDQVDASVFYNSEKVQTSLAYYGSFFKNNNDSLTWQNAYTSAFGADSGQLALEPDNQFNQFILSGGFHLGDATLASAEVAMGRMEQNDSFLPYTTNTSLNGGNPLPPLPSNSLNGVVDTLTANLNLVSQISEKWRLNAAYTYNDRDNKTPQLTFDSWVSTDINVNGPRTTLPYSFTENDFKINADYRLVRSTKLAFGYDYDTMERTYQEVDKTKENTFWGAATVRARDTDLIVKIAKGVRDVSNYTPVPEIQPPENPLLRKYNMADRERLLGKMHVSILPVETITLGLSVDYATDDYTDSQIGLIDGSEVSVHADAAMMLGESTNLHFFIGQQKIESSQAGSQTLSTPDWYADNNDTITTAGIGLTQVINEQLDIGADFTVSRSVGEVTVTSGIPYVYPDNVTNLDSLKLYANYRLKEDISLYLGYWYERYDSSNWALDGVTPDTIPNVISLGIQSPSYDVSVVALALRYQF